MRWRWLWLLRIIVAAFFILAAYTGGGYWWHRAPCFQTLFMPTVTRENARSFVYCWLTKRDPKIFDHCKVILLDENSDAWGYVRDKDDHIEVMGWVCAQKEIFWVNKKTKRIDKREIPTQCYISWDKNGVQSKTCPETVTELFP